ncbi:MAG: extracellular solute-binding protein [Planctomycetota bacterium]
MTLIRNTLVCVFTLLAAHLVAAEEVVSVYVSLDREHSEKVIAQFEKETGIQVDATYDTEANKTVGLMRKLIAEKAKPVADVWWNNEIATTIKLKQHGVLAPYRSPSAANIPAEFKDAEGYWTGFAARARVLIVNTDLVKPDEMPRSMWDLCDPKWKGKIAMAKPETGTTAAHASALYVLDEAKADEYFDKLIANDLVWRTGNAHVMKDVSAGRFAFGWTDTDDFNVARIQNKPVQMVYPDSGEGEVGVLYIPNTLVLIKGGPNPANGKKLIDWLLRPEIEQDLAHSATAQIPVRRGVKVPDHVRRPDQIGTIMPANWERIGREWDRWVDHTRVKLESAGAEETESTLTWLLVGIGVVVLLGVLMLKRATGEPT